MGVASVLSEDLREYRVGNCAAKVSISSLAKIFHFTTVDTTVHSVGKMGVGKVAPIRTTTPANLLTMSLLER